ncbi:MAG: right-handed parallel beta-helix repeat-containing protein [Verrucomicrobia bacterium]|nr:right-handed parallel beta-helix repeat-containing protein [Verrucomicrobiota bacterium]
MITHALSLRVLLLVATAAALVAVLPARLQAQSSKIFVASYGDDSSDGSRGNPKRNFQAAHDAVATGGDIVVLDTAGYGALNISKSVNVIVPPGVNGFVSVSGSSSSGITVNAGSTDVVTLRGLIIEGGGMGDGTSGSCGISVGPSGMVLIEDCTVRNFAAGISLHDGQSVAVYNTTMRDCHYGLERTNLISTVASNCRMEGCPYGVVNVDDFSYQESDPSLILVLEKCSLFSDAIGFLARGKAEIYTSNCTIIGISDELGAYQQNNAGYRGRTATRRNNNVGFTVDDGFTDYFSPQ